MGLKQVVVPTHSPFTFDNIPFGVIQTSADNAARCATVIGDFAVDLAAYARSGSLEEIIADHASEQIFAQV